jgi:hypothetical protein
MKTRPIAVWGNMDSGHGPFPPTPAILPVAPGGMTTKTPQNPYSASGNVKVGCKHKNVGVHRQFDVRIPHISVSSPFPPELFTNAGAYNGGLMPYTKSGSRTVKTNGVETARVGSPVICSSKILSGIKTVMIGE